MLDLRVCQKFECHRGKRIEKNSNTVNVATLLLYFISLCCENNLQEYCLFIVRKLNFTRFVIIHFQAAAIVMIRLHKQKVKQWCHTKGAIPILTHFFALN